MNGKVPIGLRVSTIDVAPHLRAVFAEIESMPAMRDWLDVAAFKLASAAEIPMTLIVVDHRQGVISAHAPAQDGASGPMGHLGECIGRVVLG